VQTLQLKPVKFVDNTKLYGAKSSNKAYTRRDLWRGLPELAHSNFAVGAISPQLRARHPLGALSKAAGV
jgi:hypothetical protein